MSFLISFLLGPILNPSGNKNNELYDRLGVSRTASQNEITQAFRKKSLQLHPDKKVQRGQQIDHDEFQKLSEAYGILNDPAKRKIYDRLGPIGITLYENPMSVDYKEIGERFSSSKIIYRARLFCIFLPIFLFFLSIPILIALRMNNYVNFTWMEALIPVWIIDFGIFLLSVDLIYLTFQPVNQTGEQDEENQATEIMAQERKKQREVALFEFLKNCCMILIQLFFFLRLDHTIQWNWFIVFIPWFCWSFLVFCSSILTLMKPLPELPPIVVDLPEFQEIKSAYAIRLQERQNSRDNIMIHLFRVWFAIMLGLKLNQTRDWSWWVVFVPFWVWFGLKFLGLICKRSPQKEDEESPKFEVDSFAYNFCCLFVMIAVMAAWLQKHNFSSFIIFIPIFIVFCCICCFFSLCVLGPSSSSENEQNLDDLENKNNNQGNDQNVESTVPTPTASGTSASAGTSPVIVTTSTQEPLIEEKVEVIPNQETPEIKEAVQPKQTLSILEID